ncbi:hypothetical protein HRI_005056700 [Hibiscus trionum]|uniref:Uncharacterized protein n=1 Tax=Hibiscus trionum TaxID=183268 RepID=A0A9W7JHL6_HIBTR|nr:hypothetical protein HRI_005056700 [Hibiscus trionum]
MEATFRAKRALFSISKLLPQCPSPITRASLSTSYNPAVRILLVSNSQFLQQSMVYVICMIQVGESSKHQPIRSGESAEDTAKDGIKKVVEMAEDVGDAAKETVDGAWKAAKDTARTVKESATGNDDKAGDGEVNSIEELRAKAGGYDKARPTS